MQDKVQMAGNEKLYQMAVLNIAPHSNTQLRVECSVLFFFHLDACVSTSLLRGDTEKETIEKPEKAFYEKQAAKLKVPMTDIFLFSC